MALPFSPLRAPLPDTGRLARPPGVAAVARELPKVHFEGPIGSPMQSLALARPSAERRAAPLEAFSRTEKIIAFCRVLLAIGTLAVVVVDPKQPSFLPTGGYVVLGSFLAYSLILFALVRGEYVRQDRIGYLSTAADIAWVSVITIFTERGPRPFFLLHVFVISSASVRWGLAGAVPVTVTLALGYPLLVFIASRLTDSEDIVFHRAHLFRPLYLLPARGGLPDRVSRRARAPLEAEAELHAGSRRPDATQPEPWACHHPSRTEGARLPPCAAPRPRGARWRQRGLGAL